MVGEWRQSWGQTFLRSDSDGLEVVRPFYEAGGRDTRPPVHLHDVSLHLVADGDSADVRAWLEQLAASLLARDDVSELVWTVTAR